MTAGKGIVHAEMPGSFEENSLGFQLWINLEAKNKFCEPQYQEFQSNAIPVYNDGAGMKAKVVSGEVFGVRGPIEARTPAYFIDFNFEAANKTYRHSIPAGWNSMIVIYKGSIEVQGSTTKSAPHGISFQANPNSIEDIEIKTMAEDTKFIMLAGKPINEPIANYGPFVLTT